MGGGKGGDKAAERASRLEYQGLQDQIAEQRAAFDFAEGAYQPFKEAGLSALEQYRNLIGIGGADAQQQAMKGLQQSPMMQAQMRNAQEGILQNAAATGGLRGGNVQNALARTSSDIFNQQYLQQVGLLGGMQEQGANVIGNLSNIRAGNAAATGQAMAQQGAALGQGVLGAQAARQQSGSGMMSGALSGAMAGAQIGGPWGAAAGGVIGALGGK